MMDAINEMSKINEMKSLYPNCTWFRTIRYLGEEKYTELLRKINYDLSDQKRMKEEYFPSSIEKICTREMSYNDSSDSAIIELLIWGYYLINNYKNEINRYLKYKNKYEKLLFKGCLKEAGKIVSRIEQKICYSMWGKYQYYLLHNLDNKAELVEKELETIEKTMPSNCASLLLHFYSKMSDGKFSYEKYLENVQNLLDSGDCKNPVWKYFDYKLTINKEKNIHGIKIALVIDEQISIIDYYESYIDALLFLQNRTNIRQTINKIIENLHTELNDFRIRNMYLSYIDIDADIVCLDDKISYIIENYTCGKYHELENVWNQEKNNLFHDFTICNIFVKAGINISSEMTVFLELWSEIEKIYNFTHQMEISTEKLCGFYKLLYNTTWRYKILGILSRKLNFVYNRDVLRLSILHDKSLTPLFYQCIGREQDKLSFLKQFESKAPATYQLHNYLITGQTDEFYIAKVEKNRRNYYKIKLLFASKQYNSCIECVRNMLEQLETDMLYYQERLRRILFGCYLAQNNFIDAMTTYVNSYLIGEEQIVHMELPDLIKNIEFSYDDKINSNICRPIIMALYYNGATEEIISSYLDFLELQSCNTIIEYIDKYQLLDARQTLFLWKVCSPKLLMKDYVSKTITNGHASELRALILKKLICAGTGEREKYIAELNSIYKETQLKTKIDSFNHNRIFIDRENLCNYLLPEVKKEFARYNVVQEIRTVTNGHTIGIGNEKLLMDIYWDRTRFFSNIIERIKKEYLNESPYSLEDFLSTRIRHNYCNDKLKQVFEEETLFSKKETDSSHEYTVNTYWQDRLSSEEYDLIKYELSSFSYAIDQKIQEIKASWIRIKKDEYSEGMFNYLEFTYYFMNCMVMDFELMLSNPNEFVKGVIKGLDIYTEEILKNIRKRIDSELSPYYYNAILQLENGIKRIEFNKMYKAEMLRKIEISKAKYKEDIEGFKDIFNMDNEKYPDFDFDELIEFCNKIESDMNKDFSKAQISICNKCENKYKGNIFPFLVDILGILVRNAVQHSRISDLEKLECSIKVEPYANSFIAGELEKVIPKELQREYSVVINVKNNLDASVNEEDIRETVREIVENVYSNRYREDSNKEGGSGLYKIARTVDYNLGTFAVLYPKVENGCFDMFLVVDLEKYEVVE